MMSNLKHVASLVLLAAAGCNLTVLLQDRESLEQQRSLVEHQVNSLYSEGYDGADLRALDAAWEVFSQTKGLKGSELDKQNYWFEIEAGRGHRIVEIYPKPRPENEPEPPELPMASDYWLWGTSGTFWVNKASFEVDGKFVWPTDR